jgi:hypothetical protein
MKQKTIKKFEELLEDQIRLGLSKKDYEKENGVKANKINETISYFRDAYRDGKVCETDYSRINLLIIQSNKLGKEKIDDSVNLELSSMDEELSKTEEVEDDQGNIIEYVFDIKVRNKPNLSGRFSRDEMNMIYRLYSSYGSKLTQREVSRFFPEFSLFDFRRILRAFNITKASAQFAPHVIRENTHEDLLEMAYREKENNFLTTLENEQVRKNTNLVKEYFTEIQKLRSNDSRIDKIAENFFKADLSIPRKKLVPKSKTRTGIFHVSDLHVGAKVEPNSMFPNEYNIDIMRSRLNNLSEYIISENYDQVIINLLGDMLDGFDNQTARRDHFIPQNMNNFEQVNNYLQLMDEFFLKLLTHYDSNHLFAYSVGDSNHDGASGYTATKCLFYKLEFKYGMSCILFDTFFGHYKIGDHQFIITHGKDSKFQKRPLPMILDDKTKVMIYDWLEDQGITGRNIHFIKGDLHTDGINTHYKLDYRNVLSLFGASDYGMLNYYRTGHGVSYEVLENDNLLRGVLTNI